MWDATEDSATTPSRSGTRAFQKKGVRNPTFQARSRGTRRGSESSRLQRGASHPGGAAPGGGAAGKGGTPLRA